MTLDHFPKKPKAVRRSFVLPPEIVEALGQIQFSQGHDNMSEALRFCVAYTFDQLSQMNKPEDDQGLKKMVSKNYTLLQYILLEVIKTHDGTENLSSKGQDYLKKLNKEVKSCLKQRGISHE